MEVLHRWSRCHVLERLQERAKKASERHGPREHLHLMSYGVISSVLAHGAQLKHLEVQ